MSAFISKRCCTACNQLNPVVLIHTALGDRLCRRCWRETTQDSGVYVPPTPTLDRVLRLADLRAAGIEVPVLADEPGWQPITDAQGDFEGVALRPGTPAAVGDFLFRSASGSTT